MRDDEQWAEVRLHLSALRQEYEVLCQEFWATHGSRRWEIYAQAMECVREFQRVFEQYRARLEGGLRERVVYSLGLSGDSDE